jgi:hypothetical protein
VLHSKFVNLVITSSDAKQLPKASLLQPHRFFQLEVQAAFWGKKFNECKIR